MRFTLPVLLLILSACDAPPPQLADAISPGALAEEYPRLIPLGPVADIDALLPAERSRAGETLLARAADLRRRAAALQAMPLN